MPSALKLSYQRLQLPWGEGGGQPSRRRSTYALILSLPFSQAALRPAYKCPFFPDIIRTKKKKQDTFNLPFYPVYGCGMKITICTVSYTWEWNNCWNVFLVDSWTQHGTAPAHHGICRVHHVPHTLNICGTVSKSNLP